MPNLIGGNDTGLLNTFLFLLYRDDRTHNNVHGHNEQTYVNVSNGNLVIQHTHAYLPSQGEYSLLVRTYNSRGVPSGAMQGNGKGWAFSPFIHL